VQPQSQGPSAVERAILPVGRSGWAIAAGYAGLLSILILPAPLALGLGIVAAIDLSRHPEKHGWGRTVFGLLAGLAGTVALVWIALQG